MLRKRENQVLACMVMTSLMLINFGTLFPKKGEVSHAKTSKYTITEANLNVDFSKVPMFLVTEIVPDSSNIGGADGYEFIEVYNNTDKNINFKDYKLLYRNGAQSTTDVIWPSVPDDLIIKSKDTLVFWIINDTNGEKTVADFNKNYGTSLVENQNIVRVYNASMANTGPGKDEFVIELDMQAKEKRVSTDSFEVNVYTDTEIGKAEDVKSGKFAEVKWNGLIENNSYSWYAVATDDFTGKTVSNIWTFTKGKADEPISVDRHRNY